ncbi:pyrroline-5-carboxylate reductase [Xylanimonas cellulosilytica DSM 15894]|uniref:Pyrroline-5-carboxylate reductase n=1 Tax=Xylanimonas cellulosilytica (strain DSM 15894 / JCM 12276 / CECT 5975 / KCTC 9989 / LMG 20990 / NBRC 107835 / XIL07) TaxID=446471 RepID=D1BVG7_XYLCX|nr:pyrroline-5-carboxylate reductase [Xylanimonas cellulosilytica]ACZ29438.1 pyrroline-5-carboxylate reductase [Xylanimonas cellulosilytica DSM 15894]
MNLDQTRLALLGTGNMGEAVLAGALRAGVAPANVVATSRRAERVAEVAARHGVRTTLDNVEAVRDADVVVVAVKPKDVGALLTSVGDALAPHAVVVSVAAGLSAAFFEGRLPGRQPVVRVMPNTPAAIGAGMSAVSRGTHATDDDVALVLAVLEGTGDAVEVPEAYQAASGAVAGSGPAYMFYVLDALAEAGVAVGLSRDLASRLAVQTMLGSARLIAETGEHPALARERVTSPGGTTVQGLRALDEGGVRAAFIAAVEAARDRTNEIAAELEG